MKVAIIGAGIAGLSCAYELERCGIKHTIYEMNSFIGDVESHISAILLLVNRPMKDPLVFFKDNYGINIKPVNPINVLTHYSQNKRTSIKDATI